MTEEFRRSIVPRYCMELVGEHPTASTLLSAFMWKYSPQGFEYWEQVWLRLRADTSISEEAREHLRSFAEVAS